MNSVVESGFRNEGRDNMPALLFNSLDFFFSLIMITLIYLLMKKHHHDPFLKLGN